MNIYLIRRTDPLGYDEASGFVIKAENLSRARQIAAANCGDEGPEIWKRSGTTNVNIGVAVEAFNEEVILRDYRAG
jgi:hypothetical protein